MSALELASTVIGTPDPRGLAAFYVDLLGWGVRQPDDGDPDWVVIKPPGGGPGLSFQAERDHVAPVWPAGPGQQQMQLHLDLATDDLPAAVARAVELGAREAGHQPQELVRVMLDPAGHPFCLFAPGG